MPGAGIPTKVDVQEFLKIIDWTKTWLNDESGAVTVDWSLFAAAIVGLGVASVAAVRTGTDSLAGDISAALSSASIAALGASGDGGITHMSAPRCSILKTRLRARNK